MEDELLKELTKRETVTWKTVIFELIEKYNMDPWDINVSLLARRYISLIKRLKEFNFLISGKVLVAASFLLRLKSFKLVNEEINEFDRLMAEYQRNEDDFIADFYSDLESDWGMEQQGDIINEPVEATNVLVPRTPQPRKRKVSVFDLVEALQKAMEVHERKMLRQMSAPKVDVPKKKRDITEIIKELYERIKQFFTRNKGKKLTLSELVPSHSKSDIIQTIVPLLHLSHIDQRKVDLLQKQHFGEIQIKLLNHWD